MKRLTLATTKNQVIKRLIFHRIASVGGGGGQVPKTITDKDNFRKAVELKHGTEVDTGTCLRQHTHSSSRLSCYTNVLKVHICSAVLIRLCTHLWFHLIVPAC